jgi:YidC/Oxa1 family membrane protein insertase
MIKEHGYEYFEGIQSFCKNGGEVFEAIKTIDTFPANFNVGPINFGLIPSFDFTTVNAWLLLLPVLTFVIYFFSMKINRKLTFQPTQSADDRQQACSNNMMDFTMPLMSVWMTFIMPAAVGVYWVFKSILGVIKQFIMSKVMPMPKFTEEDYKAAERELFAKQPKKVQKSANAGKVRSLHHIDDEDYDEKGNYVPKAPEVEEEKKDTPETLPENKLTEGASLKDDSDRVKKSGKFFGNKKDQNKDKE